MSVTGSGTIAAAEVHYSVANVTYTLDTLPIPGAATLTGMLPADIGMVTPIVGVYNGSNALVTLSGSLPVGIYSERVTSLSGPSSGNYIIASSRKYRRRLDHPGGRQFPGLQCCECARQQPKQSTAWRHRHPELHGRRDR